MEVGRLGRDQVVRVVGLQTARTVLTGGEGINRRDAARNIGRLRFRPPFVEKDLELRVVGGRLGLDQHSKNGEPVLSRALVHDVKLGSEELAVDRVLRARVNVELQSLVHTRDPRDLHGVQGACRLRVRRLDTVVEDVERHVRNRAGTGLSQRKDGQRKRRQSNGVSSACSSR